MRKVVFGMMMLSLAQMPAVHGQTPTPVRTCESLASVPLANVTIESAAPDPKAPSLCRVMAASTHPPTGDKVTRLQRRLLK